MRRGLLIVLVVVTVLGLPSVSAAAGIDKFLNVAAKSAPNDFDLTPPFVCLCKDGGQNDNKAGTLRSFFVTSLGVQSIAVTCQVLGFNPSTGAFSTAPFCNTWDLLPK